MYEAEDTRYCYPGTTVLKNRAGLREQVELEKLEAVLVTRRALQGLPTGKFTISHYRKLHRHLFGDVYTWAGQYRTVRIAKGNSMFCYPENISAQMRRLFAWLTDEHFLRDLEKQPYIEKLAHFLSEMNAIHPFREGNGRTQNYFALMLAAATNHPIDFERIEPAALVDAMIRAYGGDDHRLRQVLAAALRGL